MIGSVKAFHHRMHEQQSSSCLLKAKLRVFLVCQTEIAFLLQCYINDDSRSRHSAPGLCFAMINDFSAEQKVCIVELGIPVFPSFNIIAVLRSYHLGIESLPM